MRACPPTEPPMSPCRKEREGKERKGKERKGKERKEKKERSEGLQKALGNKNKKRKTAKEARTRKGDGSEKRPSEANEGWIEAQVTQETTGLRLRLPRRSRRARVPWKRAVLRSSRSTSDGLADWVNRRVREYLSQRHGDCPAADCAGHPLQDKFRLKREIAI